MKHMIPWLFLPAIVFFGIRLGQWLDRRINSKGK